MVFRVACREIGGGVSEYTDQVREYLRYCKRARADLEAAGSHLDPKNHPTEAGCLKMVFHRADQAEAAKIRQAFREVTGGSDDKGGNPR